MKLKKQSLFFIFFIFLAKEILVFNEEFLIFLSFIFFICIFSIFIKNYIYLELSNQTLEIQQEFLLYDISQQKLNLYLLDYYSVQKGLFSDIINIVLFIEKIIKLLFEKYLLILKKFIYNLIENKFKKLITIEKKVKQNIQKQIVVYILKSINYNFRSKNVPSNSTKLKSFFKNKEFLSNSINIFLKI